MSFQRSPRTSQYVSFKATDPVPLLRAFSECLAFSCIIRIESMGICAGKVQVPGHVYMAGKIGQKTTLGIIVVADCAILEGLLPVMMEALHLKRT
jgi:hypothetical protein